MVIYSSLSEEAGNAFLDKEIEKGKIAVLENLKITKLVVVME